MLKHIFLILVAIFSFAQNEVSVFDMVEETKSNIQKPIKSIQPKQQTATKPKAMTEQEILGNFRQIPQNIAPTDEPDTNLKDTQYEQVIPTELKLSISNMPRQVYVGEIFKFTLTADVGENITVDIQTNFSENENVKWLNPNLQWENTKNGIYKADFYVEISQNIAVLPKITLNLRRNGEFFQTQSITLNPPKLIGLKTDKKFNNVVADSLDIKKYKTSKFDDKNLIMVVEIIATNANISDFYIDDNTILKQGVDSINGRFNSQNGYYFAIFEPTKEKLEFNYFNLKSKKFVSFSRPIIVEDDEISTQIGLNPKQSKFEAYKDIVIYILLGIFFVLFLFRRSFFYLVLVVFLGGYSIYNYNPFGNATIKQNINVRILPTINSTVFYTTKEKQNIEILGQRDEFRKILFDDGKIGWVQKDDLF